VADEIEEKLKTGVGGPGWRVPPLFKGARAPAWKPWGWDSRTTGERRGVGALTGLSILGLLFGAINLGFGHGGADATLGWLSIAICVVSVFGVLLLKKTRDD
jgi:hypothetical protein